MEFIKVDQACVGGYRPVVEAEIMSSHTREKGYKMHLQVKLDELSEITSL